MIENNNYILGEVPNFHPIIQKYERKNFWRTEKRKCVEGYWVSGKWMPGPLYYYKISTIFFLKIIPLYHNLSDFLGYVT